MHGLTGGEYYFQRSRQSEKRVPTKEESTEYRLIGGVHFSPDRKHYMPHIYDMWFDDLMDEPIRVGKGNEGELMKVRDAKTLSIE